MKNIYTWRHMRNMSYMEDHLQKKDRLDKEWEALCSYQAEPAVCTVAQEAQNVQRNRQQTVLVSYDTQKQKAAARAPSLPERFTLQSGLGALSRCCRDKCMEAP
ncbi:hypothetical protein DNTS_006561 [Danionella cerebrum]|uniref:Uncharacterized protein n=1 Tax=Danionella cerebrum TaxID=2873325 RepID=A0A553R5H3_9TELE|nr:hypothetical protein DNTS_006561 [Danionella translucida]